MPLESAVTTMRMDSWGMYSVETTAQVHDEDVTSPWEEFVCLLSLPLANYTNNRTTIYYPGKFLQNVTFSCRLISQKKNVAPP